MVLQAELKAIRVVASEEHLPSINIASPPAARSYSVAQSTESLRKVRNTLAGMPTVVQRAHQLLFEDHVFGEKDWIKHRSSTSRHRFEPTVL